MMRTPAVRTGASSRAICRRDPGVPWKAITGVPSGSPISAHPSSRPSGRSRTVVASKMLIVAEIVNTEMAAAWDGEEGGQWADDAEAYDATSARYLDVVLGAAAI